MAERSYSGDPLDHAYSSGPWARDGETVGPKRDTEGEETTTGTPDVADIRVSEGDSGDATPGFDAGKTDLDADARREELRSMVEAVGRSRLLDTEALADRYGVSHSRLSGDLAKVERERWSNEHYEVAIDS